MNEKQAVSDAKIAPKSSGISGLNAIKLFAGQAPLGQGQGEKVGTRIVEV
jgi:hypothetical protein